MADQAFAGGKPELAIGRPATGRLESAGTFQRWHSIARAVNQGMDGRCPPVGALVQFRVLNSEDASVRTDPKVAAVVLLDAANEIVRQTLRDPDRRKMAVLEPIQAAAIRADPQRAIGVQMQALDKITGESVLAFRNCFTAPFCNRPSPPPIMPNHNVPSGASAMARTSGKISPSSRSIAGDRSGLITEQAGVGSHPGHAVPSMQDGQHRRW